MKPIRLDNLAGVQVRDIELTELLSEGGMGVVYRAYQPSLKRDVCLKLMRSQLIADDDWLQRFNREAAALSELRHAQHVVNVYFVDTLYGVYPYICMEFVEGRSLRWIINQAHPADWRWTCNIFLQICDTLADVHDAGFVHRDLKPDNIMLASKPTDFVKILDFGLCATTQQGSTGTLTKPGDLIGSTHYMAPECFTGASRGSHVDIYAIGCMFYESLAGVPPFTADTTMGVAFKHANEQVPPLPDAIAPALERQLLEGFIRKACAKDASQRFASCAEMSVTLRQILDSSVSDTAAQALRVLVPNQPPKRAWWQSSTAGIIFATASVVLLFAVLTGATSSQSNSAAVRQEAETNYNKGEYEKAATLWRKYLSDYKSQPSDLLKLSSLVSLADCEVRLSKPDSATGAISEALPLLEKYFRGRRKKENPANFAERDTLALKVLPDNLSTKTFWKEAESGQPIEEIHEAKKTLRRIIELLHTQVKTPSLSQPQNLSATLSVIELNKHFLFLDRINHTDDGSSPELNDLLAELEFRQRHYADALSRLEIFEPSDREDEESLKLWREISDPGIGSDRQQLAFLTLCRREQAARATKPGTPSRPNHREVTNPDCLKNFLRLVDNAQLPNETPKRTALPAEAQ